MSSFRIFRNFLRRRMVSVTNGQGDASSAANRGALIIVEGVDRSGKSTHSKKLVDWLQNERKLPAKLMKFPDRESKLTGSMINSYLQQKTELSDAVIHLLFSANRWEVEKQMRDDLNAGTTLVIDRYAFSGVAYTAAKESHSLTWCKGPDVGLPRPDRVYFLDIDPEEAERREEYGNERYEKLEFQKKVRSIFHQLKDDSWKFINAARDFDEVDKDIHADATSVIEAAGASPAIRPLWQDEHSD